MRLDVKSRGVQIMKPPLILSQEQNTWRATWYIQLPFITTQHTFDQEINISSQFQYALEALLRSGYGFTYVFYKHHLKRNVEIYIKCESIGESQNNAEALAIHTFDSFHIAMSRIHPIIAFDIQSSPPTQENLRIKTRLSKNSISLDLWTHPVFWSDDTQSKPYNFIDMFNSIYLEEDVIVEVEFQPITLESDFMTRFNELFRQLNVSNIQSQLEGLNPLSYRQRITLLQHALDYVKKFEALNNHIDVFSSGFAEVLIYVYTPTPYTVDRILSVMNQILPPLSGIDIPAIVKHSQLSEVNSLLNRVWSTYELATILRPPLIYATTTALANFEIRNVLFPAPSISLQPSDVTVGTIVDNGLATNYQFKLSKTDFNNHMIVAGITGSGKTTTIIAMLRQLASQGIPFLVLDPLNKQDYRALIPQGVNVYTFGKNTYNPLQFNPFQISPNISIGSHITSLMGVFRSAFAMTFPVEAKFDLYLRDTYWNYCFCEGQKKLDLSHIIQADRHYTFPTIQQFISVINHFNKPQTGQSHFSQDLYEAVKRRADMIQAHLTDIFQTENPSFNQLITTPSVIELGNIGDPERIHFVMGLFLLRFFEEITSKGKATELQNVIVIEEAHRFMTPAPDKNHDIYEQILAEARGYGTGIIIADQMPGRLIPGVLGNTNTKLIHRVDDRHTLTEMTGHIFDIEQQRRISQLQRGELLAIHKGYPYHVRVPLPSETP